MLSVEQNERLARVGPGTPGGELMRRYWHPVTAVSQMNDKYTMKVRLLGEDLVLYKDRSGTFGLIDPLCPHRRMGMIYGIPENNGLRCPYHGWVMDETGQCIEQPYEETVDAGAGFKDKIKVKAYPVQEMAGLLFTYMGPSPAPLLPRWDVYTAEDVVRDIGYAHLDCNWLQCQENSLDPVHLEWLHVVWTNFVVEMLGETRKPLTAKKHQEIGFDNFEYGIIKRRVTEGGDKEDTAWADGHPIVFPNMLRQGASGDGVGGGGLLGPAFQIRTPIDDYNTAHWYVACYAKVEGEEDQRPEEIPFYTVPVPHLDENNQPRWELLDSNSAQDPAAWITQGKISDRDQEHLGRSDIGIIQFRQMLEENIRLVEQGKDPMNVFRDPEKNKYLWMRTERHNYVNILNRQGAATKYSPILDRRENNAKPLESIGIKVPS
jgi:5,5'-dehydrodivanillate O-demethylase